MNIRTRRTLTLAGAIVALVSIVWQEQADGAAAPIKQPETEKAAAEAPWKNVKTVRVVFEKKHPDSKVFRWLPTRKWVEDVLAPWGLECVGPDKKADATLTVTVSGKPGIHTVGGFEGKGHLRIHRSGIRRPTTVSVEAVFKDTQERGRLKASAKMDPWGLARRNSVRFGGNPWHDFERDVRAKFITELYGLRKTTRPLFAAIPATAHRLPGRAGTLYALSYTKLSGKSVPADPVFIFPNVGSTALTVLDEVDPGWAKSKAARQAVPGLVLFLRDNAGKKDGVTLTAVAATALALGRIGDNRAVEQLIEVLKSPRDKWPGAQAVGAAATALRSISGQGAGSKPNTFKLDDLDPKRWHKWWSGQPEARRPITPKRSAESEELLAKGKPIEEYAKKAKTSPKALLPYSKRTILTTRKFDRFAFAAVWEATGETDSSFERTAKEKKAGVFHFSQGFKLVTALAGKHPPEFDGRWAYRCATGAGERPIRKGERVILIIHRGGMCAELVFAAKALADTLANRASVVKAVKAAEHVKMLKENIGSIVVELHIVHRGLVKAMRETNLVLSAGPKLLLDYPALVVRIDKKLAEALLDHLAETGYFARADYIAPNMRKTFKRPPAPAYLLTVSCGGWGFQENLGWDVKMLKRLDALRTVLKGDAAKAMDKLLKALEPQRKKWEKAADLPALVREYAFRLNPRLDPKTKFEIKEHQVEGLWDALKVRVFHVRWILVAGTPSAGESFFYHKGTVTPFVPPWNCSVGGHTLTSGAVNGGNFYYSYSCHSLKYHGSVVGKLSVADGKLKAVKSDSYPLRELLVRDVDGKIRVEVGGYRRTFNSWQWIKDIGTVREKGDVLQIVDGKGKGVTPASLRKMTADYQKIADRATFEWRKEAAGVAHSVKRIVSRDYTARIEPDPDRVGRIIVSVLKNKEVVFSIKTHEYFVFRLRGDVLYYADFWYASSGCTVVAYDLKAKRQLWRTRLKGLGLVEHSAYHNGVTMDADGALTPWGIGRGVVVIHGREMSGDYIEFVDLKTGKTVGHRTFNVKPKPKTKIISKARAAAGREKEDSRP